MGCSNQYFAIPGVPEVLFDVIRGFGITTVLSWSSIGGGGVFQIKKWKARHLILGWCTCMDIFGLTI